jgi:hypothetical protein
VYSVIIYLPAPGADAAASSVGLYKLHSVQLTHSLKATGSVTQPLNLLKCDLLVSKLSFKWVNLYRYTSGADTSGGRGGKDGAAASDEDGIYGAAVHGIGMWLKRDPKTGDVVVSWVDPGGKAERAGVAEGSVLTACAGGLQPNLPRRVRGAGDDVKDAALLKLSQVRAILAGREVSASATAGCGGGGDASSSSASSSASTNAATVELWLRRNLSAGADVENVALRRRPKLRLWRSRKEKKARKQLVGFKAGGGGVELAVEREEEAASASAWEAGEAEEEAEEEVERGKTEENDEDDGDESGDDANDNVNGMLDESEDEEEDQLDDDAAANEKETGGERAAGGSAATATPRGATPKQASGSSVMDSIAMPSLSSLSSFSYLGGPSAPATPEDKTVSEKTAAALAEQWPLPYGEQHVVGLYSFNPVDPLLESARFRPLNRKCAFLVSKVCFRILRCSSATPRWGGSTHC